MVVVLSEGYFQVLLKSVKVALKNWVKALPLESELILEYQTNSESNPTPKFSLAVWCSDGKRVIFTMKNSY